MSPRNTKGCRRLRHVALKGLAHKFTHSKLHHRDSSSKSVRGIWGETKLTNFRVRAPEAGVGTFLSEGRSADRCHCSFPELSSHPAGPAQEGTKSVLSINLVNIVHPLVIPSDPAAPNSLTRSNFLQQLLHRSGLFWFMLQPHSKDCKLHMWWLH